jgi:hypothetical protein
MKDLEPKKFGKYQLLQKIALGGMAELYRSKVTRAHGFEKLVARATWLRLLLMRPSLRHCFSMKTLSRSTISEASMTNTLSPWNTFLARTCAS